MKILTFSSLYPNAAQPTLGLFVEQRLRQLVLTERVTAEVVSPVPWFPFRGSLFGRYARFARVPRYEVRGGIRVSHPRYPVIPAVGMNLAPYLMAWTVRRAVRERIAAGFDFDMIDAHYFYPDGVAAAMLGRWFRRPVVVTARGTDINVIAKLPRPGRMIARAAREAAAVIAVSRALGDELLHLGVPADRVHVLRNGVDLDRFRPANRAAARTDLGLAGEVLLVVGNLTGGKGHLTVLEALVRLPHATLVIAGDGPLRRALQARARSLGIKDRVRFCGAVPQGELPAYYNAASMLVLVSEREGMPNVVLEALACGTPVIATAVGGIPEIMTDPAAGIVLADGSVNALVDAVTRLLGRSPCAEAIRLHAEKFGWQPTTAAQLDLFTGILARS